MTKKKIIRRKLQRKQQTPEREQSALQIVQSNLATTDALNSAASCKTTSAQLSSSKVPTIQRRELANSLGHSLGNRHLYQAISTGASSVIQTKVKRKTKATTKWSIKLALSGGAGHAGLGGAFAIGKLKNRKTGQVVEGEFMGGGIGIGLQTPGASPPWGNWVNFTTEDVCTFEDFDGTLARLTTAGVGLSVLGYSLAWISFPLRGANSIYVGGFNMGAVGADAGTNVGTWNVHDSY